MLHEVRHRFLDLCELLTPKVRHAFLSGKITLPEAQEFSSRSRLENKGFNTRVNQLHIKRHEVLIRTHADINKSHKTIEDLADELSCMPDHISLAVIEGKLTPLQARYAVKKQFGTKSVLDLSRVNVRTVPYRARKFRLGTEGSICAPIVRVRPHLPKRR